MAGATKAKSVAFHDEAKDIALKSFFLGPQAENASLVLTSITTVFQRWFEWRRCLFPQDGKAISENDQGTSEFIQKSQFMESNIHELVKRFEQEVPKFSPRYIGHMFSEISLPALFGHIIALLHNPNNVASDASRIGVKIEEEAVQELLKMVGYSTTQGTGHFTSGGTIANLEALLFARARCALWLSLGAYLKEKDPTFSLNLFESAHMGWHHFEKFNLGKAELKNWNFFESNLFEVTSIFEKIFDVKFKGPVVLVPNNKHYSWQKNVSLLGFGEEAFWSIELDDEGKLCIEDLERKLKQAQKEQRPVLMVVSVAGTTELGEFDPIHRVQKVLDFWKKEHHCHIWHHVDAAYGGFFCTLGKKQHDVLTPGVHAALDAMASTDSLTLDPHKLGYVPFASGTILVNSKKDYSVKIHHVPYLQFDATGDRGLMTIEGSRSATGASATWMTAKSVGFNADGYGRILERTIKAKQKVEKMLRDSNLPLQIAPFCETNILCFSMAKPGEHLSKSNERTMKIYDSFSPKKNGPFIFSKTSLKLAAYKKYFERFTKTWSAKVDTDELTLIRMCLMNPFFDSQEMQISYPEALLEALALALIK